MSEEKKQLPKQEPKKLKVFSFPALDVYGVEAINIEEAREKALIIFNNNNNSK
jgi:hypothetical protein